MFNNYENQNQIKILKTIKRGEIVCILFNCIGFYEIMN